MSNDSAISYCLGNLKPQEERKICIYILLKENYEFNSSEDITEIINKVKKQDKKIEFNNVKKYWEKYMQNHILINKESFDEQTYNIYKRSILLFPLLANKKTGGIIAGLEIDEEKEKCRRLWILLAKRCMFYYKSIRYFKNV